MHNTAEASLRAYYEIGQPDLTACQRKILRAMQMGCLYSRRELEAATGLRSGTVCGRVKELLEAGLLEVCGLKECRESGKTVEALRLVAQQLGFLL